MPCDKRGLLQPVDEETEIAMYAQVQAACAAHGYERYEISNFARPGCASQHNLRYWQGGAYLGLGAGAHSFSCTPGWGDALEQYTEPKSLYGAGRSLRAGQITISNT